MVKHLDQAMVELKRIVDKGFSSYFLITQDIIDYSRLLNYNTGPGRGSAAGSIVAYALGIVDINALKFGLSFDRFLSPSRGGYMLNVKMD
jgi:DNA polymerase-3 subunit alpha